MMAFNWVKGEPPHECEGLDTEGLPDYALLDYYDCGARTLIEPEFVYRGLRKGVELIGGESIKGYCYVCRFDYRHEQDETGGPYKIESHCWETYAVFMTDGFQVYDACFIPCDTFGKPERWEERFEEVLWDQNNDQ